MILNRFPGMALVLASATMIAVLAAAPMHVLAGEQPKPSPQLEQALEARAEVNEINEAAREEAPPAVRGRCDETLDVTGIGDACVTPDGLLRVEQADGRSHTIHGLDAPPVGAQAYSGASQNAISGASVANIRCVDPSEPRYVLVYAYPGSATSRYSTIAPKLRTETYKLSAFIDSESRSVSSRKGKRLPMECSGGAPVVRSARLSGLTAGSADFNEIVDGLRALGYQFNGDQGGDERYIVYFDAASPSGAAGTGHVFTTDSSATASNANNRGGLYAVEYRYDGGGGVPHWEVLIHEVIHTMGAVVNVAPNSSNAGHCTDGQDIMCYRDTASTPYVSTTCAVKVLDCGRNDYFHPAPASGSYLATSWNVAATYNRFLQHEEMDAFTPPPLPGTADTTRPSRPARVSARRTPKSIIFSWSRASDNVGVTAYEVRRLVRSATSAAAVRRSEGRTARPALALPLVGLRQGWHVFEVVALDAAGNVSTAQRIRVRVLPDTTDPSAPRSARVVDRTASSVTLSWSASTDNIGVSTYRILQRVGGRWVVLERRLDASFTSLRITQLEQSTTYYFAVQAVDAAGNVSARSNSVAARVG